MNDSRAFLNALRLCVLAVAAMLLLALPATASAKRHDKVRDRNHDGLPDKWEKKHGLSTKARGVGKADADSDGLSNRGEFRSRTNPKRADSDRDGVGDADEDRDRDSVDNANEVREGTNPCRRDSDRDGTRDGAEDADRDRLNNGGEDAAGDDPIDPDTDGDGIKDGDERAGEITAWDGTTLTIAVFGGATISGTVDEDTWIECEDSAAGDDSGEDAGDDSDSADDESDDAEDFDSEDSSDDAGDGDSADPEDADDAEEDEGWKVRFRTGDSGSDDEEDLDEEDAGCALDVLKVGAVVTEASFQVTGDGTFFDSIEIAP